LIAALEDVEQFEAVDTSVQIKSFLTEIREIFRTMIRTVNIKSDVLSVLESISDLSYAWQTLEDYISVFHDRIKKDPSTVVLLRATFLKAASMLDVPLVRITSIDSPDAVSVAAYYSGELVEFVRRVLEVIPISVFNVLAKIVNIQTSMAALPMRLEAKDLKDYAQLDTRCEMAKLTHEVSIFTEGILVMEKTLLGVIQVEPRQILEEGLRRELVRQVANAMHRELSFSVYSREEINKRMSYLALRLDGLKRSIEYLQDYIAIPGLKIYQQEFSRIINYYAEQEANRYIKKKTFDSASRFQSKAIPIPRLLTDNNSTANNANANTNIALENEDIGSVTFMGRVMSSLLALTDPSTTVFAPECSAWFLHSAPDQKQVQTVEQCGIRTFALLERSIGVIGLQGLNRLLAFRTVHAINQFIRHYEQNVNPFRTLLDQVRTALYPEHRLPENASKLYANAVKRVENLLLPVLKVVRKIGQGQLLRRQICHLLDFGCQLDAHLLYHALDTFNKGLVKDIRKHYLQPDSKFS
jgi:WASH complex subunit strumpellin